MWWETFLLLSWYYYICQTTSAIQVYVQWNMHICIYYNIVWLSFVAFVDLYCQLFQETSFFDFIIFLRTYRGRNSFFFLGTFLEFRSLLERKFSLVLSLIFLTNFNKNENEKYKIFYYDYLSIQVVHIIRYYNFNGLCDFTWWLMIYLFYKYNLFNLRFTFYL